MTSREINRIKSRLGRTADQKKVFGGAVKHIPWYSVNRTRNVIIYTMIAVGIIFSAPITMFCKGFKGAINLERERSKFLKQLDEEER